ncbi:glycosyltransferase [Methylomonas sp. LL1]|uniref:glycosyltransferase n=1 Tax=Methylomonas sp. LL1 TaxID=2785785 RepID=UPI0018C382B2|nr:glycosyltransferase [Methylomonas sp. LL1]QPK62115.1 glycosyltransferase [Methylomonas sp. LL1]
MKIVHTEASMGFGGQEMRILTEALGLKNRGHQLTLLCPRHAEIYSIAQTRGLDVVALPIGKKRLAGLWAIYRWLSANRPDVVNTHSSTDSWLTALAAKLMPNPPAIVRSRHISAPIGDNAFSRWLYTKASRHIVTTGEKLRRTLIDTNGFPAEQVSSIRTGIDLQRFKPGDKQQARLQLNLPSDKTIIGIVATLRSWKGHRYLLEAFAALPERENLHLLIVGDGPQWDALHELVKQLNLVNNVSFAGRQNNIQTWLQALDIFCLPSYANEGVPQALMQAQACGIPAVTTLVGSIDEAVLAGESALIVSPENTAELQQALAALINNPDKRRQMGAKAAEFAAENFSDSAMLDAMERVFMNACAQSR